MQNYSALPGTVSSSCRIDEIRCGDGMCLDKNSLCDRHKDCEDGYDEAYCEYENEACTSEKFMCLDKTCIYLYEQCDGYKDCSKGEDERNCGTVSATDNCKRDQFYCHQTDRCIPLKWTCDGMDDCDDGEDESPSSCKNSGSTAMPLTAKCPTEFSCTSGDCIPWVRVCDDVIDCLDSSDEGPHCGASCKLNNGGCGQKCRDTPMGAVCSCSDGFIIHTDGKACSDVDECLEPGHCSHKCENTKGGFKCTCEEGYKLTSDRRRCKVTDGLPKFLILASEEIYTLSVDGHEKNLLVTGSGVEIRSLDFDNDTIYWIEKKGMIHQMAGKTYSTLVSTETSPSELIFDWVGNNLYFTSTSGIDVCRKDGKYCANIITTGTIINSLTVAPRDGFMFWSTWENHASENGQILRTTMDGAIGLRRTIVNTDIYWPSALIVDPTAPRLYWADTKKHTIEVSDLDGSRRTELITQGLSHPNCLAILEDFIFWSDWGTKRLGRANKFSGKSVYQISVLEKRPRTIRAMHPAIHVKGFNPCAKAKCDHICLIKHAGYSCRCGHGYKFNSSKSCVKSEYMDEGGQIHKTEICSDGYCLNGGTCSLIENLLKCSCLDSHNGQNCEFQIDKDKKQPVYSWVAEMILGSLAASLILLVAILLRKRYSRKICVLSETVQATFPNPLFDLLPKSGKLVVETDEASGEDSSSAGKGVFYKNSSSDFPASTYVCNTTGQFSELYRSVSSDSVDSTIIIDNKKNLERSLLPPASSTKPLHYLKRL